MGKQVAQVGRDSLGDIFANDAEVYGKWSQALSSAADQISRASHLGPMRSAYVQSLIIPALIVPDGALWRSGYGDDGKMNVEPEKTNRCSLFVGRDYGLLPNGPNSFEISHLEILTVSGLKDFVGDYCSESSAHKAYFAVDFEKDKYSCAK